MERVLTREGDRLGRRQAIKTDGTSLIAIVGCFWYHWCPRRCPHRPFRGPLSWSQAETFVLAFFPVFDLTGPTAVPDKPTLAAAHASRGVTVGARIDGGGALFRLAHHVTLFFRIFNHAKKIMLIFNLVFAATTRKIRKSKTKGTSNAPKKHSTNTKHGVLFRPLFNRPVGWALRLAWYRGNAPPAGRFQALAQSLDIATW